MLETKAMLLSYPFLLSGALEGQATKRNMHHVGMDKGNDLCLKPAFVIGSVLHRGAAERCPIRLCAAHNVTHDLAGRLR
jgi:hypothetical protein